MLRKLNFLLLLRQFAVNISTRNIDQVVSMLFFQRRRSFNVVSTFKWQQPLASLAKWLSIRLRTKWLWVRISLLSLKLQMWRLHRARSSLTFRQTAERVFTLKLVRDMIITYSCFNVETTSINICRFNFRFQPTINVETNVMNVDNQRFFNIDATLMWLIFIQKLKDNGRKSDLLCWEVIKIVSKFWF